MGMLRGFWTLTWVEIKIFVREPLGLFGSLAMPVIAFALLGRLFGGERAARSADAARMIGVEVPVFAALLIATSGVLSLVAIISIYREGGILKRLRATPLQPYTILSAHVVVKLLFTAATLALLVLFGRPLFEARGAASLVRFGAALIFTTVSLLSVGFVIAAVVPTARFAQPIGTFVLYPLIGISGLFVPIDALPSSLQLLARVQPFTYAVSLLRGAWLGEPWSAHLPDIAALILTFAVCVALSTKIFRWE
jgi:ABC-2 type transport system permease protein